MCDPLYGLGRLEDTRVVNQLLDVRLLHHLWLHCADDKELQTSTLHIACLLQLCRLVAVGAVCPGVIGSQVLLSCSLSEVL